MTRTDLILARRCGCYAGLTVTLGKYCGGYVISECSRCRATWAVRL